MSTDDPGRPPSPPQDAPRRMRRRTIALLAGALTLVLLGGAGLGVWAVSSWVRGATQASVEADDTAVASGAAEPAGERRAFYAFGHTSSTVTAAIAGLGTSSVQRLRFTPTVDATSFRVMVRNWQYIDDTPVPGEVHVESVYVGLATDDDARADFDGDPVRVLGPTTLSGDAVGASVWIDASTLTLEAGRDYVVSMALSHAVTQELAVGPDESWIVSSAPSSLASAPTVDARRVEALSLLDAWVEYGFDGDEPVVAVAGHSLNTGANGQPAAHPHSGESSAWHALWSQQHPGAVASLAAPGSWSAHFLPGSPKWQLAQEADVDVLALWASSSDLVGGTSLDETGYRWQAIVDEARATWPGVRIVAFTEPPRGAEGAGEQAREDWNAFLRTMPDGVDALVDADDILADPADATILASGYDGDGVHMTVEGHQAVADAFATAMSTLGY